MQNIHSDQTCCILLYMRYYSSEYLLTYAVMVEGLIQIHTYLELVSLHRVLSIAIVSEVQMYGCT